MKIHLLEQEQILPVSLEEAWEFFSKPKNLDSITPDDMGFVTDLCEDGPMYEGQIITYRIQLAPFIWTRWVTEIKAIEPRRSFIDEQRFGPYKFWMHRHSFESVEDGVRMRDRVAYGLGFGPFGQLAHVVFVRNKLEQIFGFRRDVLAKQFGGA